MPLTPRPRKAARPKAKPEADPKPLSWTPRRRGATYCSPACGGGCTVAAHDLAVTLAAALVARLGPGWRPRVWENLGWHWSAVSATGHLKVHPAGVPRPASLAEVSHWMAFLGDNDSSGGRWVERARTPEAALRKVRRQLYAELGELTAWRAAVAGLP